MSPRIPESPKVTVIFPKVDQHEWVRVVSYTEKARLSTLTEIELTLAIPEFAVALAPLLGSQIEVCIETPHMDLLLKRAADLSGAGIVEGECGACCDRRSVFGTVTEIVETRVIPPSTPGHHGFADIDRQHGPLFLYHLSVRPRVWMLGQRSRLRLLTDISVPDIVKSFLQEAGFLNQKDYQFLLTQSYEKRSFTIQYNETDLAFISRLTEHWGISFFFEHRDGRDVIVFTDGDQRWKAGQVPVLPFTDTGERLGLVDLNLRRCRVPGRYILRDYNPDHPTVDWTRSGLIQDGDEGEVIEYCSNFESMEEGDLLLRARLDALQASRMIFSGQVAEAVLEVGTTVQFAGYPAYDLKPLSLISVELDWKSPVFFGDSPAEFSQRFEAVVAGLNVRPERRAPALRIDGVIPGMIEASNDQEYAELDKDGGYRVRLMVDDPQVNLRPYAGVRMMQPHGGQGYGFHFPLRSGTEVALSFIDGNPDRPVISGTMPNPQHSSPIQNATAKSNVIRTGGGNEINFQDSKGNERIKLTSPHGNSLIQIGSPNFPNSGITLDTLGAMSERAGVGGSLLTPVLDTTTQISKSLSRKQILTSSTDGFGQDWKALLDTPALVGKAFESINAVARQMVDIHQDLRGAGKVRIGQYEIIIDELEWKRKTLSGRLNGYEISRRRAWRKYKLPPEGFLTEEIKKMYENYFKKEGACRERISNYSDSQTTSISESSKEEIKILLIELESERSKLYEQIKDDPRYMDLSLALEKEIGITDNKYGYGHGNGQIQENYSFIGNELLNVTHAQQLHKIEKDLLEAQYGIDAANTISMDFARRKSASYIVAAASVGEILQTMTMLESLASQRGSNVAWNIAPGPLYAPGLQALETGVPPILDVGPLPGGEPRDGKESYLSSQTRNIISHEFNCRNFIQGWETAQTEVSSEHALTLSSELRMLQSAKIIAINAWCKETEYLDPARGLWEKFKDKIKLEGKADKAVKMASTVVGSSNFLLSFLASPITSAVSAASMIASLFRKNLLSSEPESPAGTLLLRGENRTLVTSDRHVEIGTPVIDITAKTIKSCTSNDITMMSGKKEGPGDWSCTRDSSALMQLTQKGSAIIWANKKIEIAFSEDKCQLPLVSSIRPTGCEWVEVPPAAAGGDSDMTRILLSNAGLALQAKSTEKINMAVGKELSAIIDNKSFKISSKESYFEHSSSRTQINSGNAGEVSIQSGRISLRSGENELTLAADGITINGMKLNLQGKDSVELSCLGTVSVKGAAVQVQGTAETSIGSGSSPTKVQGATVMLG